MTQQKSSWLRKLIKICLWILGILAAVLIAIYYYLGSIVKGAINQFVPPITGTDVKVEHVDLSLLSGRIEIRGLEIGNPKGYSQKNIFELGQIKVEFQPKTLLSDKIIIDSIVIADTKVSAELKNLANLETNVGKIQKNVNAYLGGSVQKSEKSEKTQKATQTQTSKAGKSVGVKKLQINGTEVALGLNGQSMKLPLPNITQSNIGMGQKAVSFSEMLADILNKISGETVQAISKNASQIAIKSAKSIKEVLKNNGDDLESTAKETLNSLKGLWK